MTPQQEEGGVNPTQSKWTYCDQCGRKGVRRFKHYAADEKTGQWPATVCANTVACINRASKAMHRMVTYE
jgi:hypothetical protein